MILRLIPLLGVLMFLAVGFVLRAWIQHRRYGTWGINVFRSWSWRQRLRDSVFVAMVGVILAQAVVRAAWPDLLTSLEIVPTPDGGIALVKGALLLFGGTALMLAAQLHLGASWRIGIEEGARPGLVTDGLYRFCRNPIFFAMFVVMAGLTLLLPTWISVLVQVVSVLGVRAQVVEEEAYLSATYGDSYRDYARRVGRFVPALGRLA